MTFDYDQVPLQYVAQLLHQAAARSGFTPAQIAALVDCDLDTPHLLDYITAVMSGRMN
jgi:hypothetical protein